jgi:hypothetical protein
MWPRVTTPSRLAAGQPHHRGVDQPCDLIDADWLKSATTPIALIAIGVIILAEYCTYGMAARRIARSSYSSAPTATRATAEP